MSGLTHEWHLKRENGIKYWIDINGFSKKKRWPAGKVINSREFKISESIFRVDIYPNGNTSNDKAHVSVFLENRSNWRVRCSASLKVKHHMRDLDDDYYQAVGSHKCSWGLSQFVSHVEIEDKSLLATDSERFTLEVEVDLLEEEVISSRPVERAGGALRSLKSDVFAVKEELESQKKEMEKLKKELSSKMSFGETESTRRHNELKQELQALKASLWASRSPVECPACMEDVKPPMRLKQCGEGHVICDTCFDQDPGKRCIVCRGPITGRPTALENLLGLTTRQP